MRGIGLFPQSKNFRAFVLAELLIAMLLSTLVIALGYWLFRGVEQTTLQDRSRHHFAKEFLIFRQAFEKDSEVNDSLTWDGRGFIFSGESGQKTEYFFNGDSIIRQSINYTDIFHPALKFMHIEMLNDESQLVKKLDIHFQPDTSLIIPYTFIKQYSSRVLLKAELESKIYLDKKQ